MSFDPLRFFLSAAACSDWALSETSLNIKSGINSIVFALAATEHVPLRVEEFVSQLPVYRDTSGRKLSRAPIEHVSPSVISQDGSPWRLIHLFSPASGSTTAEGRRNTVEFPHHKPMRCFLRGTMLIKLTVLPLILGNWINKKSWVLGVTTLKYLPLTPNGLWGRSGICIWKGSELRRWRGMKSEERKEKQE